MRCGMGFVSETQSPVAVGQWVISIYELLRVASLLTSVLSISGYYGDTGGSHVTS